MSIMFREKDIFGSAVLSDECYVYKHSRSVKHLKVSLSPNECVPTNIKDTTYQTHGSYKRSGCAKYLHLTYTEGLMRDVYDSFLRKNHLCKELSNLKCFSGDKEASFHLSHNSIKPHVC